MLAVRCARGGEAPARTHQSCQGRVERVPFCFPLLYQSVHPEVGKFYGSWVNGLRQHGRGAMGMALPVGSELFSVSQENSPLSRRMPNPIRLAFIPYSSPWCPAAAHGQCV